MNACFDFLSKSFSFSMGTSPLDINLELLFMTGVLSCGFAKSLVMPIEDEPLEL